MEFSEAVDKIGVIFANMENDDLEVALRDMLCLGAWLHQEGKQKSGKKTVKTALKAAGAFKADNNASIALLDQLAGNEPELILWNGAHQELLAELGSDRM